MDGLLTANDKSKLDGIEERANRYVHPDTPEVRHVTDTQIDLWTNKAETSLATSTTAGLMSAEDKAKLDGIDNKANRFVLNTVQASLIEQTPSYRLVSDTQINLWNSKAPNILSSKDNNGLMSAEDKDKLDSVDNNANNYIHPDKHPASIIEESTDKQFVSDSQIQNWNSKYGKSNIITGSAKFSGTSGVTIIHDVASLSYVVMVTPTSAYSIDPIGTVWVSKSTMSFTVYSTGNNRSDTFDYLIIKE